MQKKKGISLIVLVITIIVMIVLAGAIILSLNNAGIIENANKAVSESDKAQLKNIATLAWSDAYLARNKDSTKNLKAETIANIRSAGITADKLPDENIFVTEEGVLLLGIDKITHNAGIVEERAVYIKADKTELVAGEKMPTPQPMDRYVYDGYTYIYAATWQPYTYGYIKTTFEEQFKQDLSNEGWLVTVWGNTERQEYSEILSYINGKPVTSMDATFTDCKNLKIAPRIPETVTNLHFTFGRCENLMLPENYVIHEGVTNMRDTFYFCDKLEGEIIINANPVLYDACFGGCYINKITILGTTTMKAQFIDSSNDL